MYVSWFQALEVWMRILNGELPKLLQGSTNQSARATACDCLANVGAAVFEKLPVSLVLNEH